LFQVYFQLKSRKNRVLYFCKLFKAHMT
jgi:hypothetical protein